MSNTTDNVELTAREARLILILLSDKMLELASRYTAMAHPALKEEGDMYQALSQKIIKQLNERTIPS